MTMSHIRFLSSVLVLGLFGMMDAHAAPTVKRLGTNTARAGVNTTVVNAVPTTSSSASTQRLGTIRKTQSTTSAPVTVNKATSASQNLNTNGDEARLSLGKYIHSGIGSTSTIKQPTAPSTTPGVASDDFINLSDRVSNLEKEKQERISAGDGLVLQGNTISVDEDFAGLPKRFDGLSAEMETKVSGDELDEFASGYYTKEEIDAKVSGVAAPDLGDYAKTADVNTALNAKADKSALNNYYTKTEVYTKTQVDNKVAEVVAGDMSGLLDGKQDTISDLDDIRSGAAAGKTAVQPDALNNYATKGDLDSKADASTFNNYYTKTDVDARIPDLNGYAKTADVNTALNAKADASAVALKADKSVLESDYYTKEQVDTMVNGVSAPDLTSYAKKSELDSKANKTELEGYLTKANAAATYQPIGNFVSNPDLPTSSGDFMLVVNRDGNGGYTYSWKAVTESSGGSGGGSGGWEFDDSNW